MKGKLPITGLITLESDEAQWLMLAKGLINELKITALVEKEPGMKVRIKLIINRILSPDMMSGYHVCSAQSNLGNDISMGLSRSWEFFYNHLEKNSWMFMGYIDSEEKVSILINYYKSVNIAIYTQKLKTDQDNNFFPAHLN